jgi:hypothetical protein
LQVRIKMGLSESGKFQRIDCTNARQVDLYKLRIAGIRRYCVLGLQDCNILRFDVGIALQVH